jgi:signal transduction histidine kinase
LRLGQGRSPEDEGVAHHKPPTRDAENVDSRRDIHNSFQALTLSHDTVAQFDILTLLRVGPPAASGVVAGLVAVAVFRRLRRDRVHTGLARPYILVAGTFAVFSVAYAVLGTSTSVTSQASWLSYFLIVVPWTVFATRYVGLGQQVTRRRIIAAVAVVAVTVGLILGALLMDGGTVNDGVVRTLQTVQSVFSLGLVTFVFALVVAVVVSTYRHERLSTAQGVNVVLPIVVLVFAFQTTRPSTPMVNDVLIGAAFVATSVSFVTGVTRYDHVTRLPGTRRLGERAALTDTDEAIVVLDDERRVVRSNESAAESFDNPATLADVTEHSVATLTDRKTITCRTTSGRRQFEPSVTPLVDEYGETLGYTVTLIDVTEREIRRQRLTVLNRILRHNVRNELDVIRAHAEDAALTDAIASVDRLERLSEETRRIQQLMERSVTDRTPTELRPLLEDVVADVTAEANADASVTAPDVTISTDATLCRYAVRHLVENAVEHNDSPSPRVAVRCERADSGVRVTVADDGPGIPDAERGVIEAGTEAPLEHASSLGLWGANWAVQTVGGSLSFADSDLGGTAVVVTLPDVTTGDAVAITDG